MNFSLVEYVDLSTIIIFLNEVFPSLFIKNCSNQSFKTFFKKRDAIQLNQKQNT